MIDKDVCYICTLAPADYLQLYTPALDWIIQCIAFKSPEVSRATNFLNWEEIVKAHFRVIFLGSFDRNLEPL